MEYIYDYTTIGTKKTMNDIIFIVDYEKNDLIRNQLSVLNQLKFNRSFVGNDQEYVFYIFKTDEHLDFLVTIDNFLNELSFILEKYESTWILHQIYRENEECELDEAYYHSMDINEFQIQFILMRYTEFQMNQDKEIF